MRLVQAVKSAIAVAAGFVITFSQSHNAAVGLLVFGIFAFAYGILVSGFALRFEASRYLREELVVSVTSVTLATFALLNQSAELGVFTILVGAWALVLAANEGQLAWRARPNGNRSREHLITAGLALVLGLLFLINPMDAVSSVGFFGAYLVLSSVHLGIAAFSPSP
jgi:hypothetical protein